MRETLYIIANIFLKISINFPEIFIKPVDRYQLCSLVLSWSLPIVTIEDLYIKIASIVYWSFELNTNLIFDKTRLESYKFS